MANIDRDIEDALPLLRQYNQLGSPNGAQTTAIVKVLVQVVARLILSRINHPDESP